MDKYLAALASFPKIRTEHWQKIAGYFPSFRTAWYASSSDLLQANLSETWINNFLDFRAQVDPVEVERVLRENRIRIISLRDGDYPRLLKEIYNPPYVIYIRGQLLPEDENSIAIVGSRKGSDYGRRATAEIAEALARAGISVISGLALGLDAEAHIGALRGGGRTIAVLANGLESFYPRSNQHLAEQIIENGCIISEQPCGMPPLKQNFPARNRIISGLSQGVLVTEAGANSGTLHTASFALEQNRQLYAIPGPIYNPLAKGPNELLKNGAKAVTSADDILEDFGVAVEHEMPAPTNDEEKVIFDLLSDQSLHIDEILAHTGWQAGTAGKVLTLMELQGKVRHLGGMVYALRQ